MDYKSNSASVADIAIFSLAPRGTSGERGFSL